MGHSIRDYLQRQSTEQLYRFLQDCLAENTEENYDQTVSVIREILSKREFSEEPLIPSSIPYTREKLFIKE